MPRLEAYPHLPSVTEVLEAVGITRSYGRMDPTERDRLQRRGKALHRAIELHHKGTLDVDSLHAELAPPFLGYLDFVAATGHRPLASEAELIHQDYGFVGHIDRVGTVEWAGRRPEHLAVIDFKLSASPDLHGAKYQAAAYGLLWDAQPDAPPVAARYVLALPPGGGWRLHDVTDDYAVHVFRAALMVFTAQQRKVVVHADPGGAAAGEVRDAEVAG